MKKKMLKLLLLVAGSFLLIVAATPQAQAQESGEVTAGAPTRRKLVGEIRWKKTLGLPPSPDDKPLENICQPFYVLVVDPEQEDKLIWFANVLWRGRDSAEYYSCKYEVISLPPNKPLKVIVGMGDPAAKPYGNSTPHWYRDKWVPEGGLKPEDKDSLNSYPLPANVELRIVFSPASKLLTFTSSKDMWLRFELAYGPVLTRRY